MAKSKTKWKIEIIVLECLIIAALLGVLFIKNVDSYKLNDNATYFVGTSMSKLPEGTLVKLNNEDKKIYISCPDGTSLIANSMPLYYDNTNRMALLSDMAIIIPNSQIIEQYKLPYFTEISLRDNEFIDIARGSNSKTIKNGFLYDGEDTYVFFDDVVIEFGLKHYNVNKFSFVKVIRDEKVIVYDYNFKEIYKDQYQGQVMAKAKTGNYSVKLASDIVIVDGKESMLHSSLEAYIPLFEVEDK